MAKSFALACLVLVGCTTLGPMPATTGVSAVPHGRPGGEVGLAITPVFRLSSAASGKDRSGQSIPQISALMDPDRWAVPGLIFGGRAFGEAGDTGVEPYIGARRAFGDAAFALVGYGTKMKGSEKLASYKATRVGGELIADALLARFGSWGQLHAGGSINATYIDATGTYCADANGNGIDCNDEGTSPTIDGELAGLYSAGNLTLALDILRRPRGTIHVIRLGGVFSIGHMPRVVDGRQQRGDAYITGGLGLTFGFGKDE